MLSSVPALQQPYLYIHCVNSARLYLCFPQAYVYFELLFYKSHMTKCLSKHKHCLLTNEHISPQKKKKIWITDKHIP